MSIAMLDAVPQSLVERIKKAVQARTDGRIRGLEVFVTGGGVVISGRTSTYYAKQLVTHAAMESTDGLQVVNEVEVC
jgi:hypothetical protein